MSENVHRVVGNLLVGTSHFFVDTANNHVGINTSSPSASLDIATGDLKVGSGITIGNSGTITATAFDGDGSLLQNINSDSGSWVNGTNSNVHLATSTDKVGIGATASIDAKLHIGPIDDNHLYLASSNNAYGWILDTDDQGNGAVPFRIKKRLNGTDTTVLTIKNQDGFVGIGTNHTATRELDVAGDINLNGTGRTIYFDSTGGSGLYWGTGFSRILDDGDLRICTDDNMHFNTGCSSTTVGTERMVIKSDGDVGIGIPEPDSKLEVRGNIQASDSDTNHGLFLQTNGTIRRDYGGAGAGIHLTGNAIRPTNYLGSYSNGGIDLGQDSYRWNNVYTENLSASGNGPIIDTTYSNPGDMISKRYGSADRYGIGQYSQGAMRIFTATAYSNGTVRISGCTNDTRSSSAGFTDYVTVRNSGETIFNGTSATGSNGVVQIKASSGGKKIDEMSCQAHVNTNHIINFVNSSGTFRAMIHGGGSSSVSYNTGSDVRLKKEIKPMESTLDRVKSLKPCTFTWIRDGMKGFGFIAQDVHKILPELKPVVSYSGCTCKCGTERCETCPLCDEEHDYPKCKDGSDYYYGLDYGRFTPFLTKAIQELDAKVEEHHNRKSVITDVNYSLVNDFEGLIVSATTNTYKNGRPTLKLSTVENDKACYGVILGRSESIDNETNIQKSGDGQMWVININGTFESGDLITTSGIGGYGKKQNDDLLRSYTIAKITQSCDFTEKYIPVRRVKQEWKDVTYYIQENFVKIDDEVASNPELDVFEREVLMYRKYTKEYEEHDTVVITPEISEDYYHSLTDEEKKSYTVSYFKHITPYEYDRVTEDEKYLYHETTQKGKYIKEVYESATVMPKCCGEYTSEIRRELVNVLDEHGQLQWEDSGETEKAYKVRYLLPDGTQISEEQYTAKALANEEVYIAAFVGCTYHCG